MTNQAPQSPTVSLTRVLQTMAIVLGLGGVGAALVMVSATNDCDGELCGLGYLAAGALGIPAGVVLVAGVVSVLTQRRFPAASFGWALAGVLVAALVGAFGLLMLI